MSEKMSLEEATMKALLGELEPKEEKDDVEGIIDGVMVITDPEITPEEYEEVIDNAKDIIDDTPEGEIPFTEDYVGNYLMTCPICGTTFSGENVLNVGDPCPVCYQVPEKGFLLLGQIATQQDVELQNDIKQDEENNEVDDSLYGEEIPLEEPEETNIEEEEPLVASEQPKIANNKLEENKEMKVVKRPEQLNETGSNRRKLEEINDLPNLSYEYDIDKIMSRVNSSKGRKIRGMDDWKTDISIDFQIGDLVADEVVQELRNSLPPVTDRKDVFQEGEPFSHNANGATYLTFTRVNKDTWRYEGPKNRIRDYKEDKAVKTESKYYPEPDEMLRKIYEDYKDQGMSEEFWNDLVNYIDDFDRLDQWYEASYPSDEEEWDELDENKSICPDCGKEVCECEKIEKKEEVVPRVPGSEVKSVNEEYSFEEIVNQMEMADSYNELYNTAMLIRDTELREKVNSLILGCEDDGDDVGVAYSIVTSDLLDPLVMSGDKNI